MKTFETIEGVTAEAPLNKLNIENLVQVSRAYDRRQEYELEPLEARYFRRMESAVSELQDFFDAEAPDLVTRTVPVNVSDMVMMQRALVALLQDWKVVREARYDYEEAVLVKRLAVEVAPGVFDFVIRYGRQFWRGTTDQRMTVDFWASDDPKVEESQITFTVSANDHGWLHDLLPRLRNWMDANHFLRGRAFTAAGKFMKLDSRATWDDVILPDTVRQELQRNCVDLLAHAPLFRANGVPLRRGIVLHGPPGTGKTTIGRVLAQHCGVTFILATPGMLEDGRDVRRVFKWGRRFAPSILFFEDFDMVAASRHGNVHRGIMGEFLSCLDGLDSSEGIIAIATTNDLKAIEPALKDRPNRFDCVLEIPALGLPERVQYLQRYKLRSNADSESSVTHPFNAEQVAERTPGMTGAQMQELCRLAVFEAVNEHMAQGNREVMKLPLNDVHFNAALKRMGVRKKRAVGFIAEE